MANIKLSDYECDRGLLPEVCMFCGQPAVTRVRRTFAWHPSWVILLILINLIVMLVVALILTKKMAVRVPACDQHEGYWRRRTLILTLSGFVVAALCVGGIVYLSSLPPAAGDEFTGWICGGGIVLSLAWLVVAVVYSASGVRPTEITDRSIKLTGVHDDFVDALREERARYREGGGHRRGRYGDERDDYDDEADDEPIDRRRRPRDDRDDDEFNDDRRRRRRRDDD